MHLLRWVNKANHWLSRGLPGYCAFCLADSQLGKGWCKECYRILPWNLEGCVKCKEPLRDSHQARSTHLCNHCLITPPLYSSTTAELLYEEPIIGLIHDFKFHASPRAGILLIELMLSHPPLTVGQALLPVPMFESRARERGFNQARWLAKQLGKRLQLPVKNAICTKKLPPQHSLNRHQRAENLVGAFKVQAPLPTHVTIIDDVVTTGSTGRALAEAALYAGAKQVDIWAVARTPLGKS